MLSDVPDVPEYVICVKNDLEFLRPLYILTVVSPISLLSALQAGTPTAKYHPRFSAIAEVSLNQQVSCQFLNVYIV